MVTNMQHRPLWKLGAKRCIRLRRETLRKPIPCTSSSWGWVCICKEKAGPDRCRSNGRIPSPIREKEKNSLHRTDMRRMRNIRGGGSAPYHDQAVPVDVGRNFELSPEVSRSSHIYLKFHGLRAVLEPLWEVGPSLLVARELFPPP